MIVCSSDAAIAYSRIVRNRPHWGYRKILVALRQEGFRVTERAVRRALSVRRKQNV